jgi:hypothetical protein
MDPSLTPQVAGRVWEKLFAKSIGAELIKMSGAGFTKLDVRGSIILWSLKWAGRAASFSFKDEYMREAEEAIHSPGGIGGDVTPGVAFKTKGGEYIVFRKDDAIYLMEERPGIASAGSGAYAVSQIDRRPALLRGEKT